VAGVVQAFFGIFVDARSDPGIKRQLSWAAWFPLAYWLLSVLTVIRATIPGLVRRRRLSVWDVPRVAEPQNPFHNEALSCRAALAGSEASLRNGFLAPYHFERRPRRLV
jgi:hypothetical protein